MTNTICKLLRTLCFLLCVILLTGKAVEAKGSIVDMLYTDEVYYSDLDNDKKDEKIEYDITYNNRIPRCRIYINDKLVYDNKDEWYGYDLSLLDINTKDSCKELCLRRTSESEWNEKTQIYRYVNGELKLYCEYTDNENKYLRRSHMLRTQSGKGKLRLISDTPFYSSNLGCYQILIDYKIANKKLKKVTGNTYTVYESEFWDATYYLDKTVKVRQGLKNGKTKFKLTKGTKIYLKKIHISKNKIKYIYVKTALGKKGWIRVPKGDFLKEVYTWG